MTEKELWKIPVKWCSHMSLANEHISTYQAVVQGKKLLITKSVRCRGFMFGKSRTEYYYNGKRFKDAKSLLEEINSFHNESVFTNMAK